MEQALFYETQFGTGAVVIGDRGVTCHYLPTSVPPNLRPAGSAGEGAPARAAGPAGEGAPAPTPGPAADLVDRIIRYLETGRGSFSDVPLDLTGFSGFQREVFDAARCIPPGEVRTYGRLAAEVGRPGAARAVGNCMAANPFPLIVPCHRVVAAVGLGGWSGPPGWKQRLLELEGYRPAAGAAQRLDTARPRGPRNVWGLHAARY